MEKKALETLNQIVLGKKRFIYLFSFLRWVLKPCLCEGLGALRLNFCTKNMGGGRWPIKKKVSFVTAIYDLKKFANTLTIKITWIE